MIRLSRLTDYAIALLSHMGQNGEGELWAASDLAEESGLPMPTVAKVLKLLAKSSLIAAQRGAAGGYKLLRKTSDISVAEIIEAMDGPIAITDCAESGSHEGCAIKGECPISGGWNRVNLALRQSLQNVSLAELGASPLLAKENKTRLATVQ
ncbi:MAG: SUF system Fe-S cluster assembly regulator [Alphaproteobacteria bacterium]|nr:SUF system Fe-S cluster assembly regulator [Alphaproteobacteria bacterium]